ncbi:MAG: S1C family serine protease [Gemmataceae bacterium]
MVFTSARMLLGLFLLAATCMAAAPEDVPAPTKKTGPASVKPIPESVEDLKAIEKQVKAVLKKAMPATVAIIIPDPKSGGISAGSGVIITEDGFVLTAGHISQTPNQKCTLVLPDGKRINGETLGWNRSRDAGLIKITDKGKWPSIKTGDSTKVVQGQWCLTVGHPGGYKPGRPPVVRLGRVLFSNRQWIQTDTPLVGGDSGGPLFDLEGNVIGIHSWISQSINGNMHVPVNTYKDNWDRMVKGEEWGRALGSPDRPRSPVYLGVAFDLDTDDLKVTDVYTKTPASAAGIRTGDVLLTIDERKLARRPDLLNYLMKKKPGDSVAIELDRNGKTMKVTVTLGKQRSED